MEDHPITPEQEQELRAWARRIYAGEGITRAKHPEYVIPVVAGMIGGHVFADGRLSNTVSAKTRLQIAREEQPKRGIDTMYSTRYLIKAGQDDMRIVSAKDVKKAYEEFLLNYCREDIEVCHEPYPDGAHEIYEISDEEYAELGIEREG